MRKSQLLNIFLIVFINMVGFGLIMPLIPYYVAEYGGSDLLVGLLVATYAAAQFVGAPMLGRISDRIGRRPILAIGMIGTAFGFLLLGLAEPLGRVLAGSSASLQTQNAMILGFMVFSRLISGLMGGSVTVAQAYIADITDEHNRTGGMGILGAAFGLGLVVGPVMGGLFSQWGYDVPAYVAAALSALNALGILLMLPESLTAARKAQLATRKPQPLIDLVEIVRKLNRPRLGPLLIIRLVVSLAGALFMALFTLWVKQRLGVSAVVTSYLMAYAGVLSIVAQIGLVAPLARRFDNPKLITWGITILGAAMFAWALTPNIPILLVVMIPYAFATGVLNTVINSATSWAVPPAEMGDALGTSTALESLSRVVAPTVGGWLLGALGTWSPGTLGGVLLAGAAVYSWQKLIVHPAPPLTSTEWVEQELPAESALA